MTLGEFQKTVRRLYITKGYSHDLHILGLGLCEEAGEVAAAILDRSSRHKPRDSRILSDLMHELKDCLVYINAIANSAGIDLEKELEQWTLKP